MTVDLNEARENIRAACGVLGAYMQFRDEVGALMLALVERGDPTGLTLLELLKDVEARTGEFVISEETE